MKRQENPLKNQKGFTLIEIIAVLVILGILAAVAVPKYMDLQSEARIKAADAAINETFSRLSNGFGIYLLKNNGKLPADVAAICDSVGDTNVLPAKGVGAVPMGADYTVTLAATGEVSVTVVQNTTLTAPVKKTWVMPK